MRLPDAVHHVRTDALGAGHRAHTPMGGVARLGLESGLYNRRDSFSRKLFTPPGAGLVAQQTLNPRCAESFAPQRNRRPAHLEFFSQPTVALAFARTEDDACSQSDLLRYIPPLRQPHQFLPLLRRDF